MTKNKKLDALLVYLEAATYGWQFSRRPQLGLYYLAQQAVDSGYRVLVDSLSANDFVIQRITRLLDENTCLTIGFYVDQDNLWDLRRIFPFLKKKKTDLNIIIGGPQVTSDPELTMKRLPDALCGVLGEGEDTFVELLSFPILSEEYLCNCPGLILKNGEEYVKTSPRPLIDPLDRLSIPRRNELTIDNIYPHLPVMITGRGCTGQCAFCFEGRKAQHAKHLRLHSAERALEEFDYLVKEFDHSYISILDDTFVANPARLRVFCQGLIERYKGNVKWFCEARVDTLTKYPDLLPLMIEAGLIRLQVGGESGVQHILDTYRKGITLEQINLVVEAARKYKLMSVYINFIIGGAFETLSSYEATKNFALGLLEKAPGCAAVGSSLFTPYPGTPMYDNPEEYGIQIIDREGVTGMGDHHAFCRTDELSRFDILELKNDFNRSVHQKMLDISKELPPEHILKHFQAYSDWNLATEWFDIFSENQCLYGYFMSIVSSKAKNFTNAERIGFNGLYPIRNIDLNTSQDGGFVIRTAAGNLYQPNSLESAVLELASGKLSLDDIVDILHRQIPSLDYAALKEIIIDRFKYFDEQYFVVWRSGDL